MCACSHNTSLDGTCCTCVMHANDICPHAPLPTAQTPLGFGDEAKLGVGIHDGKLVDLKLGATCLCLKNEVTRLVRHLPVNVEVWGPSSGSKGQRLTADA